MALVAFGLLEERLILWFGTESMTDRVLRFRRLKPI
jgi:hypothetical protein